MLTVRRRSAQERTACTMYPTPAAKLSNSERRIMFALAAGAVTEKREAAADIALEINKTLCATRVPEHIRIHRLAYNEK